jgi:putative addiction module component (TIGR02574 family)
MNAFTQKLLEQALSLDEGERADLAAELIASLEDADSQAADELWRQEILRRVAELDRGEAQTFSWPEVRESLLRGDAE